jgi:pimeloyl-ACP methyl ester carboxylesterase
MFEAIMNIDLAGEVGQLRTPLLVMAGKEDVDSPWTVIRDDMEYYGGPKRFLLFEKSHHLVYVDEEDKFVTSLVSFFLNQDGMDRN